MAEGTLKVLVRIPSDDPKRRPRGQADVPRQLRAERHRHGESARHDSQSRSSFLAGPVREREAYPGDRQGRGADSQPGHADQPAGSVRLRRQAGRHCRAAPGDPGAAARRQRRRDQGRGGWRARRGHRPAHGHPGAKVRVQDAGAPWGVSATHRPRELRSGGENCGPPDEAFRFQQARRARAERRQQ